MAQATLARECAQKQRAATMPQPLAFSDDQLSAAILAAAGGY
jgi:hypothetical protein